MFSAISRFPQIRNKAELPFTLKKKKARYIFNKNLQRI